MVPAEGRPQPILVRLAALKLLMLLSLPVLFYKDAELLFVATGVSLLVNFALCKYLVFRA